MKRSALLLLFGTAGLFAQGTVQQSSSREALLIANGDYIHFGKLPNPVTDARLLAQSLQKVGFQVTLLENQSREGMFDALNAFQDHLKAHHGLALFHYGGHGVQVNGKNFLIPVDADIPDERKVSTRAVDLEEVMTTLDASGSSVNVVVLDACRDNPLPATSSRSVTRGLSVVQNKPKNSLIVYAAEPGSKAEDGLFTPALAEAITTPGKSLSQIFKDVRRQVYEKSHGNQTPGEYDQLFEDVYLSEGDGNPDHTIQKINIAPKGENNSTSINADYSQKNMLKWKKISIANYLFGKSIVGGWSKKSDETSTWEVIKQAAGRRDPHAEYLLAKYYEQADSPEFNFNLAKELYEDAASQGNEEAIKKLKKDNSNK